MKAGKYFRLPQGPADVERLWEEAEPLGPANRPDWLAPDDAARYRYAGSVRWPAAPAQTPKDFLAEVEELELAGFVLDEAPDERGVRHIYLKEPRRDPVWSIGIYRGASPFHLAPPPDVANPVLTYEDVTDIAASFLADPFMLRADGTWHLFFEVMNWRTNMGEIGLAESTDGARWTYRQIVLAEPFHLSYPYVFRWGDDYYMIPETYQAGAVRLYKASDFPTRWSFVTTLVERPYLVDASVFRRHGRWWMFVDTSLEMRNDTLRLYHAEALTGPWVEHPKSPVKENDPCLSRPAGRVLVVNDKVFRFAQSCVPYYGTEVYAFEVEELTPTSYRERRVRQSPILGPSGSGWNSCGMHHLDAHFLADGSWIACVDGWHHAEILRVLASRDDRPGPPPAVTAS